MMKGVFPTALVVAALAFTPSAFAGGTQDNIAKCRAALAEQGTLDMDTHRLRFESQRGAAKVTMKLVAIPSADDSEPVKVTCVLRRGKVQSVELAEEA